MLLKKQNKNKNQKHKTKHIFPIYIPESNKTKKSLLNALCVNSNISVIPYCHVALNFSLDNKCKITFALIIFFNKSSFQ